MKILKIILGSVGVLVTLVLIIALFVKKEYAVESEIVINKPKQEVFDYVKYLKNQDNFSKWIKMDPNVKKEYKGTDATVGFIAAWDSQDKNVGKGEQEITNIIEGNRIDYEIRFKKPFESTAPSYIITDSLSENQTKVKWGFKGKMPYPLNTMLLVMDMQKAIGNDLTIGLTNLKTLLEKK